MCFRKRAVAALVGVALCLCGCSSYPSKSPTSVTSTVLILNGADGPGPWYNTLVDGLKNGGAADRVEMVNWGTPWLVWPNLSFSPLHALAEKRLIGRIAKYREQSPNGQITLVGHSAGCGVILDALKRMPDGQNVDNVLLLAPAVSKDYDIERSLSHVSGKLHVFYSEHDDLLISTRLTGTYDHGWTGAAGIDGFENESDLSASQKSQLVQHAYRPEWKELGHLGGHFGYRSPRFAAEVLAPLAAAPVGFEGPFVRFTPIKPDKARHLAIAPATRPAAQ